MLGMPPFEPLESEETVDVSRIEIFGFQVGARLLQYCQRSR